MPILISARFHPPPRHWHGVVQRWDSFESTPNQRFAEGYQDDRDWRMAQARGPEAAQALNEAALQKDRITILPNVAAKEGVNNLPVSDKELHALGRFIAERVDIGDR